MTIKDPFVYQKPNEDQVGRLEEIRQCCEELLELILVVCPESRERNLAITKLVEVSMWANKSIVFEERA